MLRVFLYKFKLRADVDGDINSGCSAEPSYYKCCSRRLAVHTLTSALGAVGGGARVHVNHFLGALFVIVNLGAIVEKCRRGALRRVTPRISPRYKNNIIIIISLPPPALHMGIVILLSSSSSSSWCLGRVRLVITIRIVIMFYLFACHNVMLWNLFIGNKFASPKRKSVLVSSRFPKIKFVSESPVRKIIIQDRSHPTPAAARSKTLFPSQLLYTHCVCTTFEKQIIRAHI